MSEFHVNVVRVGSIKKHPNADSLSVTKVYDYPVIMRTGDFAEGDLAVYVPVDSVVPTTDPRFAFLGEHTRIQAKRLRGVFSMGLLVKPDPSWIEGQDVCEALGVKKYEPPEPPEDSEDERDYGYLVHYDIEGLRRYPSLLQDGEDVVITEKIHGENARYVFLQGRMHAASHVAYKKRSERNAWWRAEAKYGLEEKLRSASDLGFYGELYGRTGGFRYGVGKGDLALAFYDVLNVKTRTFLSWDEAMKWFKALDLPVVPVLYRGPWSQDLRSYAEGKTTLASLAAEHTRMSADHVREGMVVKPVVERFSDELGGRVILKLHGEGFLVKK